MLNWLFYGFFSVSAAYRLLMWLHCLALAAAVFAYGRQMGITSWGAATSAVSFALCGFQTIHSSHECFYQALPYLPLCLLAADKFAASGRWNWLGALGLLWGVQITLGHFQIQFWTGGLSLLVGVWRVLQERHPRRRVLGLVIALLLGLGVASVQLVPSFELARIGGQLNRSIAELAFYSYPLDHFNEKNTTLSWGASLSLDDIDPTPTATNANPDSESKRSIGLFSGWTQVLSRTSALQTTLSYQIGDGFLADPYKLVSVAGANVADSRPDTRHQLALLARYRHYFERVGALHLDYRFYWDDWDINSHTVELAWYQTLFDVVSLVPSVRYYSQSQADFYGPYFTTSPGDHYSSDYRPPRAGSASITKAVRGSDFIQCTPDQFCGFLPRIIFDTSESFFH